MSKNYKKFVYKNKSGFINFDYYPFAQQELIYLKFGMINKTLRYVKKLNKELQPFKDALDKKSEEIHAKFREYLTTVEYKPPRV